MLEPFLDVETPDNEKLRIVDDLAALCVVMELQDTQAAKDLLDIGRQTLTFLRHLAEANSSKIEEDDINKAIRLFERAGLDPSVLRVILKHVQVNQILMHVCDSLIKTPTLSPEAIMENFTRVDEPGNLPLPLLPWLDATDALCELLAVLRSEDWLLIVNKCRCLEDWVTRLSQEERRDEINENQLLFLLRKQCKDGYKAALDIKANSTRIHKEAVAENISVSEVRGLKMSIEYFFAAFGSCKKVCLHLYRNVSIYIFCILLYDIYLFLLKSSCFTCTFIAYYS